MLATSVQQQYNYISSNLINAEATSSARITSLDSNGFTIGSSANVNSNNVDYVAWNWKAGGAPTAANSAGAGNVPTAGSVKIDGADSTTALAGTLAATSISANTEAGFSIVKTNFGSGDSALTVGHGLDEAPTLIIVKRTDAPEDWYVKYNVVDDSPDQMRLNTSSQFRSSKFYSDINYC